MMIVECRAGRNIKIEASYSGDGWPDLKIIGIDTQPERKYLGMAGKGQSQLIADCSRCVGDLSRLCDLTYVTIQDLSPQTTPDAT